MRSICFSVLYISSAAVAPRAPLTKTRPWMHVPSACITCLVWVCLVQLADLDVHDFEITPSHKSLLGVWRHAHAELITICLDRQGLVHPRHYLYAFDSQPHHLRTSEPQVLEGGDHIPGMKE
jgi:hypothetical protein